MATRNRIIYASQSVIINGDFSYRVQTLGSTTTFTSEDIFELGQLDVVDVVDDVPTVAITLETNDWGSIDTVANLAGVWKDGFGSTTSGVADPYYNAHITVVSGSTEIAYYHGVALSDFGSASEFDLWAPIQTESSLGTANDNIDQTLFMPSCYLTSIELGYSTGGNATENYAAESDSKVWFLNDGRFITQEEWDLAGAESSVELDLTDSTEQVVQMSDQSYAFLYTTTLGERAIRFYDKSEETFTNYAIDTDAATASKAQYNTTTHVVTLPTGLTPSAGDRLFIRYAADAYAVASTASSNESDRQKGNYFTALSDGDTTRPEDVGALRQGQIEIYLVDPDVAAPDTAYELMLRVSSCTITATMNRETLNELGHLKPYDRPLTFPVEITTAVETTAGDLEMFAKFAGKETEYDAGTLDDIDIYNLLAKDNMILVVMIYQQTDEDAGGTGSNRLALTTEMAGTEYFVRGVRATHDDPIVIASANREYPLKTVVVPNLKVTEEAYNLSVGSNATQTFSFRSVNKLFMVKGYIDMADLTCSPGLQVNT